MLLIAAEPRCLEQQWVPVGPGSCDCAQDDRGVGGSGVVEEGVLELLVARTATADGLVREE